MTANAGSIENSRISSFSNNKVFTRRENKVILQAYNKVTSHCKNKVRVQMARPNEKLAEALKALKRLQGKYNGVIESGDLKDAHRAILVTEGFLRPVIKGWYSCQTEKCLYGRLGTCKRGERH